MPLNNHQAAIDQANDSVNKALNLVGGDPHRLAYHASPPVYWMNDPNGLIYYRGEYHLFYQHNPYGEQWGHIHWGHMKSADLVHWEHAPIALAPSEPYDRDGCFSGSAVEDDGKLILFYTSNLYTPPDGPPDGMLQQQCMALSEDGIIFHKSPKNPIIPAPPEEIGQNNHFRDPKVWKHGGQWYMVLGTKKQERGKVIVYRSQDLTDWRFFSVLTESDGTMGYMHECPDFFELGGQHILLFSPEGASRLQGDRTSGYYVGKWDYDTGAYAHADFHRLDCGFDFYAPQTMTDPRGRRILFGWMPMEGKPLGKKWAGCMTIPRELLLHPSGNRLRIRPVEEMKLLRKRHVTVGAFRLEDDQPVRLDGISGDCAELIVEFDLRATDAAEFGLQVRASEDGREKTTLKYDVRSAQLIFDRTSSGAGPKGVKACKLEGNNAASLRLHLFLDRSTLELFINDGDCVMSGFVFPQADSLGISFYAAGGSAAVRGVQFWELA